MSYPRTIQPLVIEDEANSKEYFETVFTGLKSRHRIAPPHWAFCVDDAMKCLSEERIYHLVTVDLRLPEKTALGNRVDGFPGGVGHRTVEVTLVHDGLLRRERRIERDCRD